MDNFLLLLLVNAAAVFITAYLLKGVTVKNFFSALVTSVLIGLVNVIIKPIFIFLTIPVTLVTLGLFLFVIDALLILLVDKMLTGFKVKNFGWALIFSIVLSIVNSLLVWLLN